ncbi:hypothetical protein [Clostridium akagii]|uniref:hypothetical protein n=1 Tax=Clostridium akagii TaxID=91623 RepID=UPI000479091E|nr:hypothetical protein [Clostridium akagii]
MKDHIRDYTIAAFRFYASRGISADEYKKIIYDAALENYERKMNGCGISFPTETAIIAAENEVTQRLAEINDMEAVEMTMAELRATSKIYSVHAIEIVYFKDADKELQKGDISNRVHEAVLSIPMGEATVYRCLSKARELFAEKRGLRI